MANKCSSHLGQAVDSQGAMPQPQPRAFKHHSRRSVQKMSRQVLLLLPLKQA